MAVTPLRLTWCRKPWRCARTRAARFVRLKLCCPWVCRAETRPKAVFFGACAQTVVSFSLAYTYTSVFQSTTYGVPMENIIHTHI